MFSVIFTAFLIALAVGAKYRVTVKNTGWDGAKAATDHLIIKYGSGEDDPSKDACMIYANWNVVNMQASCYFVTDDDVSAISVGISVSDTFGIDTIEVFSYNTNRVLFAYSREGSGHGSTHCTLNLDKRYAASQTFLFSQFKGSGVPDEVSNTYRIEFEVAQFGQAQSSNDEVMILYTDVAGTRRDGCKITSGADGHFHLGEIQSCEFTTTYAVAGFTFRGTAISDGLSLERFMIYDVTNPKNSIRILEWFPSDVTNWENFITYFTLVNGQSNYMRFDAVTF